MEKQEQEQVQKKNWRRTGDAFWKIRDLRARNLEGSPRGAFFEATFTSFCSTWKKLAFLFMDPMCIIPQT